MVAAYEDVWRQGKRSWPVALPTPYNIMWRKWTAAWAFEIYGYLATLSIHQLSKFVYDATGKPPKYTDFSSLYNVAAGLVSYALTIDDFADGEFNEIKDPKTVSQVWGVDITEEAMKKTIMKTKGSGAPTPVAPAPAPAPAKVKVEKAKPTPAAKAAPAAKAKPAPFAPDARLQGISITAAALLFQLATVLEDDYGKVAEVQGMADRAHALSDAFRAWGDGE